MFVLLKALELFSCLAFSFVFNLGKIVVTLTTFSPVMKLLFSSQKKR